MVIHSKFYVDLIKYTYIFAAELYLDNPNSGLQSKTSILSTVDLTKLCDCYLCPKVDLLC